MRPLESQQKGGSRSDQLRGLSDEQSTLTEQAGAIPCACSWRAGSRPRGGTGERDARQHGGHRQLTPRRNGRGNASRARDVRLEGGMQLAAAWLSGTACDRSGALPCVLPAACSWIWMMRNRPRPGDLVGGPAWGSDPRAPLGSATLRLFMRARAAR